MYLELLKAKARFNSVRGNLSMEQLFDLSLTDLDQIAVSLNEQYESSKKSKSFLTKRSKKDKSIKMKLDFVLSVMEYKQNEHRKLKEVIETRQFNNKIASIIEKKKDQELESMDIEKLRKLMK